MLKNRIAKLTLLLLPLLLTACNEYTVSVCEPKTRVDVASFEKPKIFMMSAGETGAEGLVWEVKRQDVGHYTDQSGQDVFTCSVGGKIYMETSLKKENTFQLAEVREHAQGFDVISLGWDKMALDDDKIPYAIIPYPSAYVGPALPSKLKSLAHKAQDDKGKRIVVHNAKLANSSDILKYLVENTVVQRMFNF